MQNKNYGMQKAKSFGVKKAVVYSRPISKKIVVAKPKTIK